MNPEKNKGIRLSDVAQVFKVDDDITFNCLLFAINNSIHLHLNPRAQYHNDCVKKELTKKRNKPNVREKIGKFSKERPLITSAGIAIAAGVAALPAASLTSNVISSTIAVAANSGTQALISNAFGNVGNSAGMFSGLVQPIVNGISRFTGDALGTIITIALPPLILGVSAYVFYKAFKLSFKLALNAIGKSSPHKDILFLPRENDPLFDFLCGMSTIMALKDLELELTLRGFAKIKFNFEQYKEKLTKGHTLNEEEAAIHEIAKKSAERLFAIAKKVETRKKSEKYQNFQETKEIINQIHTNFYFHAPEKSNYPGRYNQFIKCLIVVGALVNKALVHKNKDPLQKENFFQVFNSIIRGASITLIQTRETHTNYREGARVRAELAPSKKVAKSSLFSPQGNTQKRQTGIPTTTENKSLQRPSLFSPKTIKKHNTQSEARRNDFVKGL